MTKLAGHLAQPRRLEVRIGPQVRADPLLRRIKLRPRRRPRVLRRQLGHQRPTDRRAVQPRRLAHLIDRQPLDAVHAPDLRPLRHVDHARSLRSSEGPRQAGRTQPRARCVAFQTGGRECSRGLRETPAIEPAPASATSPSADPASRRTQVCARVAQRPGDHQAVDGQPSGVNGHRFLPSRGHRFSPAAVMFSPRWWPSVLPSALSTRSLEAVGRKA